MMKEIIEKINKFRDERDWRQFHNEKDLAISVSLEASELLELFQLFYFLVLLKALMII